MITTTFSFIGKNPASMMVGAGILFLLIGGVASATQMVNSGWFLSTGGILLVLGIVLHVGWLFLRRRF